MTEVAHSPSAPQVSTSPAGVQREVETLQAVQAACPWALTKQPVAQLATLFQAPVSSQTCEATPVGSQRVVPGWQVPVQPPLAQTYWQGCDGTQ